MQDVDSSGQNVENARNDRKTVQYGVAVLKKRNRSEKKGNYLLRNKAITLLEELLASIKSRRTGLSTQSSYGGMSAELLREKALRSAGN